VIAYIVKRLLLFVPILLGVATVTFFLVYVLPGDPVLSMVGERYDEATIQELRREMRLDEPLYSQYAHFIGGLVRLDFGRSYVTGEAVAPTLLKRFPYTLRLAVFAMLISVVVGVCAGVFAAWRWRTAADYLTMGTTVLGISMPVFWLGALLIFVFSMKLGILPPSGYGGGSLRYAVLPAVTLAQASTAYVARMTRSSMLDVVGEHYIQTARAKGVSELRVIFGHALRNALLPVITVVGADFGSFLTGAVLTESIFAWPGIGRFTLDAILKRDVPTIQGAVFFMAVVFMVINLLVDLAYAWADPRIRLRRESAGGVG
jgi:ABC-type dipeptide/oligopeptide/nickel transport system permease component